MNAYHALNKNIGCKYPTSFGRFGIFPIILAHWTRNTLLLAPLFSGSLFFNFKKTFSFVLLSLVDAQYKFIAVDVGAYGKNSDGGILSTSNFGKALAKNKFNIPNGRVLPGTDLELPYVIIGDEVFK